MSIKSQFQNTVDNLKGILTLLCLVRLITCMYIKWAS